MPTLKTKDELGEIKTFVGPPGDPGAQGPPGIPAAEGAYGDMPAPDGSQGLYRVSDAAVVSAGTVYVDVAGVWRNLATGEELQSLNATYATAAAVEDLETVKADDIIWSWWSVPNAVYDATRQRILIGGVSRSGAPKVATLNLRSRHVEIIALDDGEADDHNTTALCVFDSSPVLAAWAGHGLEEFFRTWRSAAPYEASGWGARSDIAYAGGERSYANLLRQPGTDTVMLFGRGVPDADPGVGFRGTVSADAGATFPDAATPYRLVGYEYMTHRVDGDTAWFGLLQNNAINAGNGVGVFQIDLPTGNIADAAGTAITGNWWTGVGLPVSAADFTIVLDTQSEGGGDEVERIRLFDVAPDGSVVVARWALNDATVEYRLMRHDGAGGYTEEVLCDGGVAFDAQAGSRYTGGVKFGFNETELILCREDAGVWTAEHWTNPTGVAGDWDVTVLATRTDGTVLARPLVPVGAEGDGLFIVQELHRHESYTDYYGDALVLESATMWPYELTDTFDRANDATGMGTSDSGHTYEMLTGLFGIENNTAMRQGASVQSVAVHDYPSANVDIDVRLTTVAVGEPVCGLVFRAIDSANYLFVEYSSAGIRLRRRQTGSVLTLVTWDATSQQVALARDVRLVVDDDVITLYHGDTEIGTHTLSAGNMTTFGRATKHGFYENSTTVGRRAVFDDLTISPV